MALHSPARFDAWLSEIRWGIDKRYILTIGYFGFEPKGSLSTPSTKVQCRSAVDGLTGSSVPPEMQRFLARKKLLWLNEWCAQPLSNFTVADRAPALGSGGRLIN